MHNWEDNGINIRDPIHGFISLNKLEEEIVQTFPFQRLRFIHQLGTTNWIYPGAVHTRFEHSLGVLQLASTVIDRLKASLQMSDVDKQVFRLASLLHDIGHAPFSHVGEEAHLFEEGCNHETMGRKMIEETKVGKVIARTLGNDSLTRIAFIITGKGKPLSRVDRVFHELLTGQAGIDRMDYLFRDSHFLGVRYGTFDLARVLETIRYDEEYDLYWEEGGYHALEQFILARYFMFTEVYFHKTRRVLDYHLGILLKRFLEEKKERQFLPTDTGEYLGINDNEIIVYMLSHSDLSRIFLGRKFCRLIDRESNDQPETNELLLWNEVEEKLRQQFDQHDYYFDKAENTPYKFEKASEIKVYYNGQVIPLTEVSKLVASLTQIRKRRIYVLDGKRREVRKFVVSVLSKGDKK